ncbi:MAG TPA: hypothetical protein VH560_13420 [Polyangia bacterium]|nr:hypothetical protein [Polyangia bacterium]
MAVSLALAAGPPAAAAAEIVVTAEPTAAVPTEIREEIRSALTSRLSATKAALVEVRLTSRSAELRVDGRTADVAISDWSAEAATRVVVVRAVDLATPPPPVSALDDELPRAHAIADTAADVNATSDVLALAPTLTADDSSVAYGAAVSFARRRGRLVFGVDGRWTHARRTNDNAPWIVTDDAVPVALFGGWSWARLEVIAGPVLAYERLALPAQGTSNGLRGGGTAALRWFERLGHGWSWVAGAGLDVYTERRTLAAGMSTYATPYVTAYLSMGIAFGSAR